MKKKNILIILSIILVVLVIFLSYIFLSSNIKDDNSNKDKKETEEEKFDRIHKMVRNNNKKLKEKHCYKNFCIKELSIAKSEELDNYIYGTIEYNGETILGNEITIEYKVGKEKIKKTYIVDLMKDDESELIAPMDDDRLLKATDYEIVK